MFVASEQAQILMKRTHQMIIPEIERLHQEQMTYEDQTRHILIQNAELLNYEVARNKLKNILIDATDVESKFATLVEDMSTLSQDVIDKAMMDLQRVDPALKVSGSTPNKNQKAVGLAFMHHLTVKPAQKFQVWCIGPG